MKNFRPRKLFLRRDVKGNPEVLLESGKEIR
jgi:hypothetical protein